MRTRRAKAFLVAVVLSALTLAACGNNHDSSQSGNGLGSNQPSPQFTTIATGELHVGSCLDYKPFEFFEKGSNQPTGFDIEITDAIAQKLNLKVVWVKANFNTIFTAVAANKFDMVAAASTITPERQKVVNFSDPYYNARQSLTVNTQQTPDIATTDDLKSGDIVGVQKGTTGAKWAQDNLASKGVQIKSFTNAPDAFTDLEAGNVTGVINDEPSSESEVANRTSLKVVEPIDTGEHYGLAFSPDNAQLTVAVNVALKQVIDDGTYQTIFQKYFPKLPVPPEYQPQG
ncbi:MAG: polar amino acid transport system substrate-binding protein [Actinomycetota bacterium]|nr:polar amino acid transport system substrate-binding protein [Actinomycetota bacterium]